MHEDFLQAGEVAPFFWSVVGGLCTGTQNTASGPVKVWWLYISTLGDPRIAFLPWLLTYRINSKGVQDTEFNLNVLRHMISNTKGNNVEVQADKYILGEECNNLWT
ncbi:hypothetical protein PM082_015211 [Marasmius tenuissimus]|nr:hypothetical protein PM082_015211 [Marasmius tenuissimus]